MGSTAADSLCKTASIFLLDHRINMRYNLSDVMNAGSSLTSMITSLKQFHNIEALMEQVEENDAMSQVK